MKQHITVEQLEQLTQKGTKRLNTWWKPERGDVVHIWDDNIDGYIEYDGKKAGYMVNARTVVGYQKKEDLLPLLSIGQMIEFLIEDHPNGFEDFLFTREFHGNLCDQLWSACKEVLERE
jgi:hypothetical protein